MTAQKKRRIHTDVLDQILELALSTDWSPAVIYSELTSLVKPTRSLAGLKIPHRRTVERIVRDERGPDDDEEPWSVSDNDADDARLILEVRKLMLDKFPPPIAHLSKKKAQWVLKIRKIAPDLDPAAAWLVALLYMTSGAMQTTTEVLDDYLALTPWRDSRSYELYTLRVKAGLQPPVPLWRRLVEEQNPDLGQWQKALLRNIHDEEEREEAIDDER